MDQWHETANYKAKTFLKLCGLCKGKGCVGVPERGREEEKGRREERKRKGEKGRMEEGRGREFMLMSGKRRKG